MSEELRRLAERLARELASQDRRWDVFAGSGIARGAPPKTENTAPAASDHHHPGAVPINALHGEFDMPPGVRYAHAPARIADYIDHTLLKAEATRADIDRLCDEAREHQFAAVCVNPVWVGRCAERLAGTRVGIATVIGFPLGASMPETKAGEASLAVRQGATELDMVAAVGHIKGAEWPHVFDDIRAVVQASGGVLVKVIIESAALTPVEIIKASALAREAGAGYVKTSTGFHPAGGATAEAVALMRLVVGDAMGVKASGGVRDCAAALRMIESGATRIGTSSGVGMAKCLGQGPLPLDALLTLATEHEGRCATGACSTDSRSTY